MFQVVPKERSERKKTGYKYFVGCSKNNKVTTPGIISTGIGYDDHSEAFKNKCLLASVILGFHRINPETGIYQKLFPLLFMRDCTKHKERARLGLTGKRFFRKQRVVAGKLLESLLENVCESLDIDSEGPHNLDETLTKLAAHYGVQIHLVKSCQERNASVSSYLDTTFDETRPQIFLNWSDESHVNLIIDLCSYFCYFGNKICFGCLHSYSFYYLHECRVRDSCRNCKRLITLGNVSAMLDPFFSFCDSQTPEKRLEIPIACSEGCNFKFDSLNCKEKHKCNRNGFHCDKCGKTFACHFKNSDDARVNHNCDPSLPKCGTCKKLKKGNHQCRFLEQRPTKKWPNLGFFTFSTLLREECVDCFELKKKFVDQNGVSWRSISEIEDQTCLLCDTHQGMGLKASANAVMLAYEKERGEFDFVYFCDDDLESERFEVLEEKLTFSYDWKSEKKDNALNLSEKTDHGVPKRFKKKMRGTTERIQGQKENKLNAVQKFLHFINTPEFQNFTFLSINGESCSHQFIMREFFNLRIKPFVIMDGNKIKN